MEAFLIYKHSKLLSFNENNSGLLNILSEINLGLETNYRTLLFRILINYGKGQNIKNDFVDISLFLLFKLISLQTFETHNTIIQLLGGKNNDDYGFLREFINILFYKIILLFIDYLNPSDNLTQSHYFVSCNLIYFFKYLCKEHNSYFQRFFIRNLSYSYIKDNHIFFSFQKKNVNEKSKPNVEENQDSSLKIIRLNEVNPNKNIIHFYDFFLYLLTKIILISNWTNFNKYDYQHENSFLFDLFSLILKLLNEIIQGCDDDLLSDLCMNLDVKVIDIIKDVGDLGKYKKIDSFEVFIKSVKIILFNEKHNSKFINEIKYIIINFIISILEEKNNNEIMKKYIKKYINIDDIYKIISIIMKLYYLNKEKPKNFEKINKKPIVGLLSTKKLNIFDYKTIERKN